MDLAVKDSTIKEDLIGYYNYTVNCAFEDDIIKSTIDFTEAIIGLGLQSITKEFNFFIKVLL